MSEVYQYQFQVFNHSLLMRMEGDYIECLFRTPEFISAYKVLFLKKSEWIGDLD